MAPTSRSPLHTGNIPMSHSFMSLPASQIMASGRITSGFLVRISFSFIVQNLSLVVLEILLKPHSRPARDFFESSWLFEEMRSAGDDAELLLAAESIVSLPIQSNDLGIKPANNE